LSLSPHPIANRWGAGTWRTLNQYGEDSIVDVTLWTGFVADGRPFKLDGMSGQASFRILHQFRLRDGLIAQETVWYDHDALAKQLTRQASTAS
jgi:hypothetical protein